MEDTFDLIENQKKARESTDPKKLFQLWEDCCRRYERNELSRYDLEEMKEVIWPNLQALASIKRIINDVPEEVTRPKRRKIS